MSSKSTPSTDLSPNAAPWRTSAVHPVPPAAGSYIPLNHSELLSAAVPGAICPVLVLPPAAHEAK